MTTGTYARNLNQKVWVFSLQAKYLVAQASVLLPYGHKPTSFLYGNIPAVRGSLASEIMNLREVQYLIDV
jgi:hypothetical protein